MTILWRPINFFFKFPSILKISVKILIPFLSLLACSQNLSLFYSWAINYSYFFYMFYVLLVSETVSQPCNNIMIEWILYVYNMIKQFINLDFSRFFFFSSIFLWIKKIKFCFYFCRRVSQVLGYSEKQYRNWAQSIVYNLYGPLLREK